MKQKQREQKESDDGYSPSAVSRAADGEDGEGSGFPEEDIRLPVRDNALPL